MYKHPPVTGNTYPLRNALRQMGGRWDPRAQGWRFETEELTTKAQAMVDMAGPEPVRSVVTRFSSGATIYRNPKGRCIDAPCCGCCS